MNEVMVLWQYSGHGELTQGHMDIHILKRFLLTLSDREGKIWLEDFVTNYFNSESNKRDVMRKDEQQRAIKVWDIYETRRVDLKCPWNENFFPHNR